ncbi:recombinase family protein [Belnapia sp. T18]|uniref:Recombinase family protein n=1 Tax=Belnapia arida TaxID=2804533 RepID=A0ABS1TWP8_9PROT|nr:recombinase family protein [Belnapia arida]
MRRDPEHAKAAPAEPKARKNKLGSPRLRPCSAETGKTARAARSAAATQRAMEVLPYLEVAQRGGANTLQQLADALTARGVPTPRGGERWFPAQVRRLLQRTIHPSA